MKRQKREGSHSDLNETGIFVFLTMVIFFVAVGFPTLINTSPTLGYEGVEWTPVTTYYQQAYAQQEVLQTLAYINYNPVVLSAFLVIPTAIDNPPPDPAQYFELKYGQPITIEQGFAETIKPEMIVLKDVNLLFQLGSFVPISWQEVYYLVEKPVFENIDDDFSPLIPSAYADSVYVLPVGENRIRNDIADQSANCLSNALPAGGVQGGVGANVQFIGSAIASGFCHFTVYTINPNMPRDIISDASVTALFMGGRQTVQDSNYDCGIARLQGVYTPHASIGEMSASETWHNATSPKTAWTTNFNSSLCRTTSPQFVGTNVGYPARQLGLNDFIDSFETNTHGDGTVVCDPTDETQCFYSIALIDGTVPFRQGSSKDASWDREYFRITLAPVSNATDGHWQMKEHSFYPTGTMDDCGFSRIGDLFRIDSGATDAEQGQCVIFKTFNKTAVGTPDVSVFLNASGTGSSEMRVFVDVMDGAMNMGNLYSGTTTAQLTHTGDMSENILRVDLGTGQNHRLGITEVDLPFEGEILIKPEYSSGSENFFTVFVGLQDNSTDGTIILDINNATIGVNINNFSKPIVRFNEHTSNFANPSPIKTELDTGYVSVNASLVTGGQSLNGVDNSTAPNTGSLGSSADALYFESDILSTFVVNSSGIINEGVIQNGTSSGGGATAGDIRFGTTPADWNFIHAGNVGDNLTSINFWLNGDVDGSPEYPLLDTKTTSTLAGLRIFTSGANICLRLDEQDVGETILSGCTVGLPADDGQWHMVTFVLDKGNTTKAIGNMQLCVDSVCGGLPTSGFLQNFTGTFDNAGHAIKIGSETLGSVFNTFNVDEVTIWNGYQTTQTDINNMWNAGVGASSNGIGSSFQLLDVNFDLQSGVGQGVVAPALPTPNVITSGTVTPTSSLLVDWIHDGINTTGYRIYRTSTEVNDTKVIFDTTTTEDFDVDLNSFESVSAVQSSIPAVEGEMISDFDILLMNDTGNPVTSEGFVRGAVFIDATISSGSNATLATSLFNPSGTAFLNTVTLPSGLSAFNFKFRGENLVNITTAFPLDIGIGVFANTSFTGDVSVGLCTSGCVGAGTPRVFNATSGVWEETAPTDDLVLRVSAVNQTKLFSPAIPLVNDTGSLDTQYLDNATSTQNTFLYRIVALNGNEESNTIVILNGTEGLIVNQTEIDVVLAIDAGVNTLFEIHQSACDSTIGSAFRVACYTFDTVDISNDTATNLGTLGSVVDAEYFSDNVLSPFVINATGKIEQAVIQNGTNDDGSPFPVGQTQGEIRFGSVGSDFNFLHNGTDGNNVTSINFWINGDVDGSPEYTMLSNCSSNGGCTDGIQIYTLDANTRLYMEENNQVKVAGQVIKNSIPADDGQWHMVTIIMDKGNTTGSAIVGCIDAVCQNTATWSADMVGNGNNPTEELALGAVHFQSSLVETTTNYDDLAIWNGYQLTQSDIDTLFNVALVSFDVSISDTVTVLDDVNATAILAPVNQTITDTATVSDSVTVIKQLVSTEKLFAYWKFDNPAIINMTSTNPPATIPDGDVSLVTTGFTIVDGIIDTGYKRGTGVSGRIELGANSNRAQYDFLISHRGNITAYNWWMIIEDIDPTVQQQFIMTSWTDDFNPAGLQIVADTRDAFNILQIDTRNNLGSFLMLEQVNDMLVLDSQFHMYTIVYDHDAGTVDWYLDGVLFEQDTGAPVCSQVLIDLGRCIFERTLQIGDIQDSSPEHGCRNCTFDELSIWNRNLTSAEISILYNNGFGLELENQVEIIPVNTTDLEVYWKFEETSGILTTEEFVNIPDADSFNDSGMTKTNTGIIGNAWRTSDAGTPFVNITGTATDWDFIMQGDHSYNLWMQEPDPAPTDAGNLFTTSDPSAPSNGGRLSGLIDSNERFSYAINTNPPTTLILNEFVDNYWDITCRPNCTSFQMVTVTANATSGELKWYKNGTLIETDSPFTDDATATPTHSPPMLFATNTASPAFSMNKASFDEWSIWSRVLTPSEITTLFNGGQGLELQAPAGQEFNQTETDEVTVIDQVNATKIAGAVIFNQTEIDIVLVIDQEEFDITKLQTDTATVTDLISLLVNKSAVDVVTTIDQVNATKIAGAVIFNQTITDTATVTDLISLLVNKSAVDVVTTIDQGTDFNVSKVFADVVIVQDNAIIQVFTVFNTTNTDTATILDAVITSRILNITSTDTATVLDAETITKNPVPNAINDLSAFAVANTCELTWSTPFNLGLPLAPINGYGIFSSVDGGLFIPIVANTSNTNTAFNHTGLNALSTYLYNVTAFNIYGTSLSSNIDSCVPQSGSDPPSIPTGLTAVNQGENVFLDWDHDGVGNPTGFKIERAIGQGAFFDLVSDTSPDTSTNFLDTTVVPATQFRYRISAINTFGTSDPSGVAGITTLFPPAQPTLTAVQDGNMITLTWTEPTSDQPINGYTIERRINFGSLSILVANTTTTSLIFDDLNVTKPNTYGYLVKALSSLGVGSDSNIVDVVFGSHTTVEVREQDGSGFKGGGTVRLENSTFTLDQALDSGSNAIFDNLDSGNYNFTFIDADNFILNKTFNFPHPSGNLSNSFTIFALVFDVDCPSAGTGTDVRIKVNYTDGKDITDYPATPVCDSSDKVSWSVRWQGDAGVDMSTMIADFISNNFKTNADQFLVSAIQTDTIYNSALNQIESVDYVVNNNVTVTDVTINFDLFLGEAPSSGGSGGGGSPPAGASIPQLKVELLQRLTGLSVLSRTHPFASAGDVIEGAISVEWEGEAPLTIKSIDVGEFSNIIRFGIPPIQLDQNIEGTGEFAKSSADISYIITLPPFICDEAFGISQNCVNEELISIPVSFVFESEGVDYTASTTVMVDLRPIPFDLPQLQIILLGAVLIISAIAGNFIRQRIRGSDAKRGSRGRKKKFKKKFDSS